jgi:HAD superfamily hydrolase (TIGR01490 family)
MPSTAEDTPGLAVFDLDYTLTRRGTWGRFVWQWVKFRPHVWLPLLMAAGWTQWQYKRGKRPRVDVKLAMMRWAMAGASQEDLMREGQIFAEKEVMSGLRPGGIKAVHSHKAAGDKLIMISAAVDVVAKPIGKLMGFDYVVSTEMDFDNCNKLKLNFKTPNCYGAEKVNRFNDMMGKSPALKQYHTNVTFYSDSVSDLAMFGVANICVAVNPDRKLSNYASSQGWNILMW